MTEIAYVVWRVEGERETRFNELGDYLHVKNYAPKGASVVVFFRGSFDGALAEYNRLEAEDKPLPTLS